MRHATRARHENRSRPGAGLRAVSVAALVMLLLTCAPQTARAVGSEDRRDDPAVGLRMLCDSRWAGNGFGGYYPVRITLTNTGSPARVRIVFQPDREMLPTVELPDIDLEQNATVFKTLLIPMTGPGTRGYVKVFRNGKDLVRLTLSIGLPEVPREIPQPSLLIVSPTDIDGSEFARAAAGVVGRGESSVQKAEIVPPGRLPTSWLAYSGLDFVALSLESLGRLPAEQRLAILQWVDTGGNLIVYSVGGDPARSERLAALLGETLGGKDGDRAEPWQSPSPTDWEAITLVEPADPYGYAMSAGVEEASEAEPAQAEPAEPVVTSVWGVDGAAFRYRDRLLGRVFAFSENPFPGSVSDWGWMLKTMDQQRWTFPNRMGASGRRPSAGFLQFLIEGVSGVPVYAFLILMTLVTIVIGPLNYILLRRRRQVYLLLLTIPALALVTSVTLFAYSLLAHGFDVKSRIRSVTFLDQPRDTAVAVSRVALFAGLAPSEGLTFSPETAVTPVWSSEDAITGGRVVWGGRQTFGGGWFRSRTRTQFYTATHRAQRGHLEMTPTGAGTLRVANGLEWDIQSALIADADGTLYHIGELPAGAEGVARRAETAETSELARLFRENAPEGPLSAVSYGSNPYGYGYGYGYGYHIDQFTPNEGRIEKLLGGFYQNTEATNLLKPNTYVAVLSETPDIETGLEETTERGGFHVLLGRY
jgi:hypothetical protein